MIAGICQDEDFDNGESGKRPTTFTHGFARKRMKANTAAIHDVSIYINSLEISRMPAVP